MIVNISSSDYSNYAHDNATALRLIGVDCRDYVLQPHKFYPSQSKIVHVSKIIEAVKDAEVIQVMHSDESLFDMVKHLGKKIIIYHTGTRYRENHLHYEQVFKGIKTISDQTEFMHLGNHKYIVSPVEYNLSPTYKGGKVKIGHYPSDAWTKGTDKIIEMLQQFQGRFDWQHSTALTGHDEQMNRMSKCDIYIELFKTEIRGRAYGCFGVTALEAAALGKIVITNNLFENVYKESYGVCPFTIANTETAFINSINQLLTWSPEMFKKMQIETHEIMKENHSFANTGNKIIRAIYE